VIEVRGLSKVYKIYPRRLDRLKEWLSLTGKKRHREYWALKDVNLDIPRGCVFGIIGMNGAGKSTLLKILTGTAQKSAGMVNIHGRVAALLVLGTGFHPELTGKENVLINGKLLGLTDDEIRRKLETIREFSELGDFFFEPVRTYSSGMYVRLAFALAASVEPDILIVDEALSVGDAYFQQKCVAKLREFKERGVTILFVSHDLGIVTTLCDQVALLAEGRVVKTGPVQECLELYNALLAKHGGYGKEYVIGSSDHEKGAGLVSGNNKAKITRVEIHDSNHKRLDAVVAGQKVRVAVGISFNAAISNPTVGILIRDRLGYDIFGTNTAQLQKATGDYAKGDTVNVFFDCAMNLGPGNYTVSAAVHSSLTHVEDNYQWVDRILTFQVLPRADFGFLGVSMLEPTLEIRRT